MKKTQEMPLQALSIYLGRLVSLVLLLRCFLAILLAVDNQMSAEMIVSLEFGFADVALEWPFVLGSWITVDSLHVPLKVAASRKNALAHPTLQLTVEYLARRVVYRSYVRFHGLDIAKHLKEIKG